MLVGVDNTFAASEAAVVASSGTSWERPAAFASAQKRLVLLVKSFAVARCQAKNYRCFARCTEEVIGMVAAHSFWVCAIAKYLNVLQR